MKQWTPRVVIKPIKIQNEEQEFDLTNVKQCTSRVVIEPIKIQNEEQDSELKALHKGGNASSNSSSIKALSKAGFDPVVDNKYVSQNLVEIKSSNNQTLFFLDQNTTTSSTQKWFHSLSTVG